MKYEGPRGEQVSAACRSSTLLEWWSGFPLPFTGSWRATQLAVTSGLGWDLFCMVVSENHNCFPGFPAAVGHIR